MYERSRPYAGHTSNRRRPPRTAAGSPDRTALWAVVMAVTAMFAALASSADGADGGVAPPPPPAPETTAAPVQGSTSKDVATWYGPGLYGNTTACGQTLKRRTVGVAHKSLPCGTRVTFRYRGRRVTTQVIDRGPYAHNATWDLTNGAAKLLNFTVTDTIRATVQD